MALRRNDTQREQLHRVQFVGGALTGATIDLPWELADAPPGRLTVTPDGELYDHYLQHVVTEARIIEPPTVSRST